MRNLILTAAIATQLAGCGALFNNSTQQVYVTSNLRGQIIVDGQPTGVRAPGTVVVNNHTDHVISVQGPDGRAGACALTATVGGGYVVLDILAGLLGVVIDAATGAWKSVGNSCYVNVL